MPDTAAAAGFFGCLQPPVAKWFRKAFGMYAGKIKESMMMESLDEAIERLYQMLQDRPGNQPA